MSFQGKQFSAEMIETAGDDTLDDASELDALEPDDQENEDV